MFPCVIRCTGSGPLSASGIFFIGLLCVLSFIDGLAQSSLSHIQKQADLSFERSDFRSASRLYKQAGVEHSNDKKARLRMAISLYEVNEVDGALLILNLINHEGKTDPYVFFYIAKCHEAKNQFKEAIDNYKRFLQRSKKNEPEIDWVKDQLIRCANGLRLKYGIENAYVENAGKTINSPFDDYGVKNSPTSLGKIYFNSNREKTTQVKANTLNIYASSLVNGIWADPVLLPAHINAGTYQEVCGFSTNGQILYYLTRQDNRFTIRTDTFTEQPKVQHKGTFKGPADINADGTDFTFFNDSICLFASNKAGGYGGYDLYISFLRRGKWSAGINLGPVINSFYDERYPFLTRNGLTLFYSSNNLESIGGFDIFSSSFDPDLLKWSVPENLGFPVNSSGDETHLVVAPDGTNAFLTSDRKDGYGGQDIYRIFFKKSLIAHQEISTMPTFQQILLSKGRPASDPEALNAPVDVKEYFISHLFLEENADVLLPQNIKKLDLLVNLMLIYPRITVELSCFEIPSGQQTFSLYFSIKKAEEAAGYMIKKGIPKDRILLKGYGPSFPLALLPEGSSNSTLYKKLNYRIDVTLHQYETEPVIIHMENIPVPENMADPRGQKFSALRHGFYYSVQIVSIPQILQNQNLESLEDMFIEVSPNSGNYRYMVGLWSNFQEAESMKEKLIAMGFPEATIFVYLDGLRVPDAEIQSLSLSYPDLLFYMGETKD